MSKKVDNAIGANGKPVIIKKNIFEKNARNHKDLTPQNSRDILEKALYDTTLYGQNQKTSRPYNWIMIHLANKNSAVVLEVNENKDNVEIVNWHYLNERQFKQKERQAEREGGRILTLASAVGNTSNDLSSESKDTKYNQKITYNNKEYYPRPDGGFNVFDKNGKLRKVTNKNTIAKLEELANGENIADKETENKIEPEDKRKAESSSNLKNNKTKVSPEIKEFLNGIKDENLRNRIDPNSKILTKAYNREALLNAQKHEDFPLSIDAINFAGIFTDNLNAFTALLYLGDRLKYISSEDEFSIFKKPIVSNGKIKYFTDVNELKKVYNDFKKRGKEAVSEYIEIKNKKIDKIKELQENGIDSEYNKGRIIASLKSLNKREDVTDIDVKHIIEANEKGKEIEISIKPEPIKITPKSNEKALSRLVSNDIKRPTFMGVYHNADQKEMVATDSYAIMVIPDETITTNKILLPKSAKHKTEKERIIGGEFVNYTRVMPNLNDSDYTPVNIDSLIEQVNGLAKVNQSNLENSYIRARIKESYFNPSVLLKTLIAFKESGSNNIEISITDRLVVRDADNKRKIGVIMHILPNDILFYQTLNLGDISQSQAKSNSDKDIDFQKSEDYSSLSDRELKDEIQRISDEIKNDIAGTKGLLERSKARINHPLYSVYKELTDLKTERYQEKKKKQEEYEKNNPRVVYTPKREELKISAYSGERVVYHGTKENVANKIVREGIKFGSELSDTDWRGGGYDVTNQESFSTSLNPNISKHYSGEHKVGIVKLEINPNANVVTVENEIYAEDLQDYSKELEGVDAVYLKNNGEEELVILNKDAVKIVEAKSFKVSDNVVRFHKSKSTPYKKGKISQQAFDQLIAKLKKPFAKAFKNINILTDWEAFERKAEEYRKQKNGEVDYQNVNDSFNNELRQLIKGTLPNGHIFQLGRPNAILQSAGLPNLPIELSSERLKKKSSESYKKNHPFDLESIKDLPNALQNPIMIFNNPNNDGKVVLTELKHNGVNHIVALKVKTERGKNNIEIQVNSIATIFPKDRVEEVADWIFDIKQNRKAYFNKEKSLAWLSDNGTTLRSKGYDTKDIAKIINNFENPKIESGVDYHIGAKARLTYEEQIRKHNPNISEEHLQESLDFLHSLEDNKENTKAIKVAVKWLQNDTIRLPFAMDNVRKAIALADKHKIDPMQFKSPMDIINKFYVDVEYGEAVNPDNIPVFTNKRTIGEGENEVIVYDVEDSEAGQRAVVKVAHQHFGYSTENNHSKQPWCLASFTRSGEPTASAESFWNNTYNSVGKKIAFQNGKPIAFMAHDKNYEGDLWWDLKDQPSNNMPLPNGDYLDPDGEISDKKGTDEELDNYYDEAVDNVVDDIGNFSWREIVDWLYSKTIYEGANLSTKKIWEIIESDIYESSMESLKDEIETMVDNGDFEDLLDEKIEEYREYNEYDEDQELEDYELDDIKEELVQEIYDNYHDYPELEELYFQKTNEYYNEYLYNEDFGYQKRDILLDYIYNNSEGYKYEELIREEQERLFQEDGGGYTDLEYMRTPSGVIYGAKLPDGTIYINPEHLNANTPIHEFAHLWEQLMPEKFAEGVELFKNTPIGNKTFAQLRKNKGYKNHSDEKLWSEALVTYIGDKGEQLYHSSRKDKFIDWIKDFFKEIGAKLYSLSGGKIGKDFSPSDHLSKFTNRVLGDLMGGKELQGESMPIRGEVEKQYSLFNPSDFDANGNVRPEVLAEIQAERESIIKQAKANGTYMKAPNGKPTNLNEEQWAMVRTQRFKDWFGDWEKQSRIEKLKNSEPIVNEYNGEYELNRESAKAWAKENVRGAYTNKDTGEKISVSRLGINKSTSHSMGDEAHLKSFVDIPNFIENSIFITEQEAGKENAKYSKYRYYVAGVKIGGEDYTVKITIGVDSNGNKFYDHALTQFEKGKLIDQINNQPANGFISMGAEPNPSVAEHKDTKLVSILQNNSSKVVDENGEPLVVYHGTNASEEFSVFKHKGAVSQGSYLKNNQVGFFFSNKQEIADLYSAGKVETKSFFINSKNTYFVDVENEITELLWNYSEEELEEYGIDLERWRGNRNESFEANDSATAYFDDHADELYERAFEEEASDGLFVIGTDESKTIFVRNPNQIKSATDNVGTYSEGSDDIRYHKGDSQSVNDVFNTELQQLRDGELPVGHIFQLGTPNAILQSAGLPNLPIEMSATRLKNKSKQNNHPFDLSEVEDLPRAIQNPIAVFSYGDKDKAVNIITELQDKNGKKYLVGVHFNQERNGLQINSLRSIFPKDNAEWLNWITQDKALYINKEKVQDLITQQRINLADVSYLDLNSIANVINNFQNPKIKSDNDIDYQIVGEQKPYFSVLPTNREYNQITRQAREGKSKQAFLGAIQNSEWYSKLPQDEKERFVDTKTTKELLIFQL